MARSDVHVVARAGAFAALAAMAALPACNALVGLSDFKEDSCAEGACDGGPDASVDAPSDAAADAQPDVVTDGSPGDAESDAGPGAGPVSWAVWPMPGYAVDGGANVNPVPTYTTAGDTVTDGITGLVWKNAVVAGGAVVYAEALTQCAAPYRLPKRIEVVTLLAYAAGAPYIDTAHFAGVRNVAVWTSSEVRPYGANGQTSHWSVSFGDGTVSPLLDTLVANVLCVKGAT